MMMQQPSRLALSKVWMCDAVEAPEAEEKSSVLDSLSGVPAEMLETIKGMTLLEVSELIKAAEETFETLPKTDDEEAAEE